MRTLVFTFIGNDSPGLVDKLAAVVANAGGNWLESRMAVLADQFAGIVRVQVEDSAADTLAEALQSLKQQGLTVSIARANESGSAAAGAQHHLNVVGNDRPGIVREVSRALASRGINVVDMSSAVSSAAMSAEPLFEAEAEIVLPAETDREALLDELDNIAEELGVDINLD